MDTIESLIPEDSGSAPALEPMAMVALDAGRMLMEAGASANSIDQIVAKVARGLGAERVDLRIGYASLAVTIGIGPNGITRMREVGHLCATPCSRWACNKPKTMTMLAKPNNA